MFSAGSVGGSTSGCFVRVKSMCRAASVGCPIVALLKRGFRQFWTSAGVSKVENGIAFSYPATLPLVAYRKTSWLLEL
jgi:hypothetical protein